MEADRDLTQRMQTSEYQKDGDRELATRIQSSRTEYHIKSRSVIGATSSSGKSKAKQASQDYPYNQQSFGSDSPEGYRYQYSDCTGRRKALLIDIDSSEIKNTSAFLRHDYGYDEANTLMLSSQPTKGSILSAMAWLVEGAQMNECLFFHYSGSTGKAPNLGEDDSSSHDKVIYPIDFKTAGHITNYEIYQVMVQPLRPGVRLTAVFDDFYNNSPLMLLHMYSAQAVLTGADFSTKAFEGVVARFSSNARRILRAMSSLNSLEAPKVPDSDIQELSRVTRTSPADVVIFYSTRQPDADAADPKKWSTAWAFFHTHRPNRQDSYAELLSGIEAQVLFKSTIKPRISCCRPLDMNRRFIM